MSAAVLSRRSVAAQAAFRAVERFYFEAPYGERRHVPGISDFTFGNPHEMPLPGLVEAIRAEAIPQDEDWFAYKTSEEEPRATAARRLSDELGLPFEPADLALTSGAFAASMVALRLLLDAGDEIIFSEPAWFCYEPMALIADAVPRKVPLRADDFGLDLAAIETAITPRTRIVVVNTPHNPTGRIYSEGELRPLADLLERASARVGRRIFVLSDEPYRRLRFDGRGFTSPAAVYPWTLVVYSYAKVLLAPGQRLGYLALSPLMPRAEREALLSAMFAAQMALGWCFPNAVMQYALPRLEHLSIDVGTLTRRRDTLVSALSNAGFKVRPPEGTFYLWAGWPEKADQTRLWNALAARDVFVLPGEVCGGVGHFRISLTASDQMVERALPIFAEVAEEHFASAQS